MKNLNWKNEIESFDDRRDIIIPGDKEKTLQFCIESFESIANEAIDKYGYFTVALSGGHTPKAIFKGLSAPERKGHVNWEKVLVFWSDERSVSPQSPESNYRMAMESGLKNLPIKPENIFGMSAETDIEENAKVYEELIIKNLTNKHFDLVMLGMGNDGHTASLFPRTHGLHAKKQLVIANFVAQLQTWRMTLSFDCINDSHYIFLYVMGENKASMVAKVLNGPYNPDNFPVQRVGTTTHKALWILDNEASSELKK